MGSRDNYNKIVNFIGSNSNCLASFIDQSFSFVFLGVAHLWGSFYNSEHAPFPFLPLFPLFWVLDILVDFYIDPILGDLDRLYIFIS